MPRKKGLENDKLTIPSDWTEDDGYLLAVTCIPNSRQWRAIWNGHVSGLSYGRNWNKFSGTIIEAQAVSRQIFEDMSMACMDDLIEALACYCDSNTEISVQIKNLVQLVAGQSGESPETKEQPGQFGEGETWPTAEDYFDAKCNAANAIFDTIREVVVRLDDDSVDILAGLFGSITAGVATTLIAAGPVGWAVVLSASVVGMISGWLIHYNLDFGDLLLALDDGHCDLVNALYDSGTVQSANSAFMEVLDGTTPEPSAVEKEMIDMLLNVTLLNQLFDPRDDVAIYVSDDPCACTPIADTLFAMSQTAPYNVLTDGVFLGQSATAFNDADGFHLPNPGDWVEFTVTPDTGSTAGQWANWQSDGELFLTASPRNGQIKFSITDMIQSSGNFIVHVYDWPQTPNVWTAGQSIETAAFADQNGGTKPATATLRISAGDGAQIIRKLTVTWIGDI